MSQPGARGVSHLKTGINRLLLRLARRGLVVVRRRGLLPAAMADRNGDDDRLAGTSLTQTVMVFFAGTLKDLYQLRQWYGPLRALHDQHPVIVVLQDSRCARLVRAESGLAAITIARAAALEDLLSRSAVKLALYVNHNKSNFTTLRLTSLVHIYLTHGDSDKGVSVSNQSKAYDYLFLSGQASIDRIQAYLMLYDAAAHCVLIGSPQLDVERQSAPAAERAPGGRHTVLYAPTWEGGGPSVAYGTVGSHGEQLVRALIADRRLTVVYRPHPLSGLISKEFGAADLRVRRLVTRAAAADPAAGHRVDVGGSVTDAFAASDLLICDVSAMAMEWLPSGKPIIITEPASSAVVTARTRMLDVVPRLTVGDLPGVAALVLDQLERDPGRAARADLVDYYLGDISPGASTKRFLEACTRAIAVRDEAWATITARGPAGP